MNVNSNLTKLFVLVITIPTDKKEIIADLLEKFEVTGYLSTFGYGSYSRQSERTVMFCTVKESLVKDAIYAVEDKFSAFRSKMSTIFAIPMDSIVGLSSYMVLSNGGKK